MSNPVQTGSIGTSFVQQISNYITINKAKLRTLQLGFCIISIFS